MFTDSSEESADSVCSEKENSSFLLLWRCKELVDKHLPDYMASHPRRQLCVYGLENLKSHTESAFNFTI
jgi:hypothetical protein